MSESYRLLHCEVINDSCEDAIESFQIAIVRAGGSFLERQKIESMTVKELTDLMTKNKIAVRYMKDHSEPVKRKTI
jgi:hypothetical protein